MVERHRYSWKQEYNIGWWCHYDSSCVENNGNSGTWGWNYVRETGAFVPH